MNGRERQIKIRLFVGSVIKKWRENVLKMSQADFGARFDIKSRFVRMIQAGQQLPSSMKFIQMVLDMDWMSRGRLLFGFARIGRQEPEGDEGVPDISEGQRA